MKILFVSGNLCNGGAQRVISVVASSLAEKGHEVFLYLFSRDKNEYQISSKVKISAMKESFEEYAKMSGALRIVLMRKYLKQIKPDVAVGFLEGGYGLFLSSLGMKFSKVASARVNPRLILAKRGIRAMINRLWFNCADALVLQTNSQKELVTDSMRKHSIVIANPVSDIALESKCNDYNLRCRKIVMAGRLEPQKNYSMALRAIKKVKMSYPDIKLDIFGKGKDAEKIQEEIYQLELSENVILHGWSANTIKEFQSHDVYMLTSNSEGMPNSLMEAMAVGLPCISTDCETGPSDLITDGVDGYLVPVNDSDMLASRLLKLIEMNHEERIAMGNRAHEKMKIMFHSNAIADKWEKLFCDLKK